MLPSNSSCLVLGATGSFGYALTTALLKHNIYTTIIVRDAVRAKRIFPESHTLEIIAGDVQNHSLVKMLSKNKTYIAHCLNVDYADWSTFMPLSTEIVVDCAIANQSTILFPGNIYGFGVQTKISEHTHPKPTSRKGILRIQLEKRIKAATTQGAKAIILRLPDFWGPNVNNPLIRPIFERSILKKTLYWPCQTDIPHQLVYTPDAAHAMIRLMALDLPDYSNLNFGGQMFESIKVWVDAIGRSLDHSLTVKPLPESLIKLGGFFNKTTREFWEMRYLFKHSIELNDSQYYLLCPDHENIPLNEAVSATLDWFIKMSGHTSF